MVVRLVADWVDTKDGHSATTMADVMALMTAAYAVAKRVGYWVDWMVGH